MVKRILLAILVVACASSTYARTKFQGYAERGGNRVSVAGFLSTSQVQASYPLATVSVFDVGTTNLSTIFSDIGGTAKANPFTSDAAGFFVFYGDAASYDVKFSPVGITPWTVTGFGTGSSTSSASYINVKDAPYNAKGDGIADDTVALKAAIADAITLTKSVYVPSGTYLISSELTKPWAACPEIFGADAWVSPARIVATAPMRSVLAIIGGAPRVHDIVLDANHNANYGLYVVNGAGGEFRNLHVQNAIFDGIYSGYGVTFVNGVQEAVTSVNDLIEYVDCFSNQNGTLYATADILAQYGGPTIATASGTVATTTSTTPIAGGQIFGGIGSVTWPSPIDGGGAFYLVGTGTHFKDFFKNGVGDTITAAGQTATVIGPVSDTLLQISGFTGSSVGQQAFSMTVNEVIPSNRVVTGTGTHFLNTIKARIRDHIRIGPVAATADYCQIERVLSDTMLVLYPRRAPTSIASGRPFAIGVGDGYHEAPWPDNNVNLIIDGDYLNSGGSGLTSEGQQGLNVIGAQMTQNGFYGLSIGCADVAPLIQFGNVIGTYSEGNYATIWFGATRSWFVSSIQIDGGGNGKGIMACDTSEGIYAGETGFIDIVTYAGVPAGTSGVYSQLATKNLTSTGTVQWHPSTTVVISAANQQIAPTDFLIRLTSAAPVTLTSTPTIANGVDGQEIELEVVPGSSAITIQDRGTLASSGLFLNLTTQTLTQRGSIRLRYSSTSGWVQVKPVTNPL